VVNEGVPVWVEWVVGSDPRLKRERIVQQGQPPLRRSRRTDGTERGSDGNDAECQQEPE
jgi:hypothetical protein